MTDLTTREVTIETLPPMRVACLRVVSATPEEDGGKRIEQWIAAQHIPGEVRSFGFDTDVTPEEEKAGLRGYEMWRTVPENVQPSEGVTIQDFPGGLYATVTLERCFEDPFERIPGGWKELHQWVVQSAAYQSAGHQWLEEVVQMEYGPTLKLYHPVMSKPG